MKPPVTTTRVITVSGVVLTSDDLRRIAKLLQKQSALAEKSVHRASTSYLVQFDDSTMLESDSPEPFADELLTSTSRPVRINMSFHNYSLHRHVSLSLSHGSSAHENSATITAQEEAWLNDNFMALKEALGKVRPQKAWFIKHPFMSFAVLATGMWVPLKHFVVGPLLRFVAFTDAVSPYLVTGFIVGVTSLWVYDWLKDAWPNVEFDFGAFHLRVERSRRRRLYLVATLIILPVAIGLIVDAVKAAK